MPIEISEEVIYELFFRAILKVPECPGPDGGWGCLTGNLEHDLIFSFFLPHLVLFIFLIMLSSSVPGLSKDNGKKGLRLLLVIGSYIFIVYTGIYGFLAYWLVIWLAVAIVISLLKFFLLRAVGSPSNRKDIAKSFGGIAAKSWSKRKKLNKIDKQINQVRKLRKDNPHSDELNRILAELKMEKEEIKSN